MPDKKEDTIIGAIGGFFAAVGGTALYQFARDKAGEFVKNKAEEVFKDHGRGPVWRDISRLGPGPAKKIFDWLDRAQQENIEGDLVNLMLVLPDDPKDGRRLEFTELAKLDSYEEFVKRLQVLDQDNVFQLAKRVVKNGGKIADKDVREFVAGLNGGAEVLASKLSAFTDKLEGKKRKTDKDGDTGSPKSGGGFASTILRWRGIR